MIKLASVLVAAVVLVVPVTSVAETGSLGVGIKAGSLGFGVELNYPISSKLSVSAGINSYSGSQTDTADGIDYDIDVSLQTLSLLAHIHPFSGSFRITGGAMINNNELSLKADSAATYDIGGMTYDAAWVGELGATVDFNKFAPYVGIGWGYSPSTGVGFSLDAGVLLQGAPKVDLYSKGGTLSGTPGLQADLAAEEASAEDDLKKFDTLPVVSAGLNIRF